MNSAKRKGVSPHPDEVRAIQNISTPSFIKELRSFLCMVTYSFSFIHGSGLIFTRKQMTHYDPNKHAEVSVMLLQLVWGAF